jgi:uncharacterized protein YciI
MAWYTVETRYTDDRDKLLAARPAHRAYLRELADRGQVLAGGPFADDSAGFAVYRVSGADELEQLLEADPYTVEGCAAQRIVREWTITLGPWAQA